MRDAHERRRERVRHLIFDNVRRLSRVVCNNDDLYVRQIGHSVDAAVRRSPDSCDEKCSGEKNDHRLIPHRPFDDFGDHSWSPIASIAG